MTYRKKTKHRHFKKTKRNKTKKNRKNKLNKKGGTECPSSSVSCDFLDTQFREKINPTWKTCIRMNNIYNHIIYITPLNMLIKSIESLQIPEFFVKFSDSSLVEKCNIMIEDKYVACFLYFCGKWYVIMRLFGKTLNTQFLARTEKNRAFYEISGIDINLNTDDPQSGGDGVIELKNGDFTEEHNKHLLSTGASKVIKINDKHFTNINKTNDLQAFNVIQRFRQEKIYANQVKKDMAQDLVKNLLF